MVLAITIFGMVTCTISGFFVGFLYGVSAARDEKKFKSTRKPRNKGAST